MPTPRLELPYRQRGLEFSLEDRLLQVRTIPDAIALVNEYAKKNNLEEMLPVVRNLGWGAVHWTNPGLFKQAVMAQRAISQVYTPDVGDAIISHKEALNASAVPKEEDAGKIDFDEQLLKEYKNESTRNKAIRKMMNKIDAHCKMVYNHFRKPDEPLWEKLPDEEKRRQRKQAIAVLTDGSRILGIGNQGEKGRKISAGKLHCYFLGSDGAVMPQLSFPFGVNFGTKEQRAALIARGSGEFSDYEEYMHLVLEAFDQLGMGMVQFEDFEGEEAWKLLRWAREHLKNTWVFNDDIEGTASMVAESLMKIQDEGVSLEESLLLFQGAGGAASGIFKHGWWLIEDEMNRRNASPEAIRQAKILKEKIYFFDSGDLLYQGRKPNKQRGAGDFNQFQLDNDMIMTDEGRLTNLGEKLTTSGRNFGDRVTMEDIINWYGDKLGNKGSVVFLATTTKAATVSENAVRAARELIKSKGLDVDVFLGGLSNPTYVTDFLTKEEAERYYKTKDNAILARALVRLYVAAEGKIRFATGSPFPTVKISQEGYVSYIDKGVEKSIPDIQIKMDMLVPRESHIIEPGQGNNIIVFPMMYGLLLTGLTPGQLEELIKARLKAEGGVYDSEMIWRKIWSAATTALFNHYRVTDEVRFKAGVLFPKAEDLSKISETGALAVASAILEMAYPETPVNIGPLRQEIADRRARLLLPDQDTERKAARNYLLAATKFLNAKVIERQMLLSAAEQGWTDMRTSVM